LYKETEQIKIRRHLTPFQEASNKLSGFIETNSGLRSLKII